MEKHMRVLVTGAGALLGQGIIRSLRASALETHIIAVDPSPVSAGLYWADEALLLPMATDPNYLARFRQIAQETRPEAILVGTDVELELFSAHRTELEKELGTTIVVSSPDVVRIANDKYWTARFFAEHRLPHPRSVLPSDVDTIVGELGYPLIVKPRVGARSVGVHLVSNREELDSAVAGLADPVIQEHLGDADHEYTAGALCFDGDVVETIVMRRDLRDGNTYRAFVDSFDDLNRQVREFAAALSPVGPANFQFRVVDGQAKVFEINARFSGTTPFRMHVGFNEVEYTLRRMVLGERPAMPPIRASTILRHWTETVVDNDDVLSEQTS
jgi:carbamoyl-phosphate synthase large subunit